MKKKNIKIDTKGSVDLATGERYNNLLKEDIQYGEVLGRGNGGMVCRGLHTAS
jgi:hypothetical protein